MADARGNYLANLVLYPGEGFVLCCFWGGSFVARRPAPHPLHTTQQPKNHPKKGRAEFVAYLPEATQGVLVQPIGGRGVLVLGSDTPRGLSRLDQAWAAAIADKLEVTLEGYVAPGSGFGSGGGKKKAAAAAE